MNASHFPNKPETLRSEENNILFQPFFIEISKKPVLLYSAGYILGGL